MNGVHDMGGMHGFGPVEREESEPVFHVEWEGKVRALMNLTMRQGYYNLDAFRYGIERMPPAEYLRASYYERWLSTVEYNLAQAGVITPEEIEERISLLRDHSDAPAPEPPGAPVVAPPPSPATVEQDATVTPRFAPGDRIMTRNVHPTGHTRLPRYARGKRGVIHKVHGVEIWPDSHAHGRGEDPRPLYSVRFEGRELWGESDDGPQLVYLDLWEPYLEPAPEHRTRQEG